MNSRQTKRHWNEKKKFKILDPNLENERFKLRLNLKFWLHYMKFIPKSMFKWQIVMDKNLYASSAQCMMQLKYNLCINRVNKKKLIY